MRSAIAFFAAALFAAAPASASLLPRAGYPNCSLPCMANSSYYGSCAATDTKCLCDNQTFIYDVAQCFYQACSGSDVTSAFAASQDACRAVGVTLTGSIPPASSSAAGSSSATDAGSTTATGSAASVTATSPAASGSGSTKASGSGSATGSGSASASGSAASASASGSSSGAASTGASVLALLGALTVGLAL